MRITNIGIFAHIDAGKTTLSESIFYDAGIIKNLGRVDKGSTITDNDEIEKKRGITINSTSVSFMYKDLKVNLIDTPGHPEFIDQVSQSVLALDCAVLVISASRGVQAQTKILFNILSKSNIPTFIFVNKMDLLHEDINEFILEIRSELSENIIPMQDIDKECNIYDYLENINSPSILNKLSDFDDISKMKNDFCDLKFFPVYFGTAIKNIGVKQLLNAIEMLAPDKIEDGDLSGIVYKIMYVDKKKKIFIRLFSGEIVIKGQIYINEQETYKVRNLQTLKADKMVEATIVKGGSIAILSDIKEIKVGDIVGHGFKKKKIELSTPSLKTVVRARDENETNDLFLSLQKINESNPSLGLSYDKSVQKITIMLYGEIQKEVLIAELSNKYGIDAYMESSQTVFMKKPTEKKTAAINMGERGNKYNASIGLTIEPYHNDEVKFITNVSYGYLKKPFQNAVSEAIISSLKEGFDSYQISGVKVTFDTAFFDSVTSTPSDFRSLAPLVLLKALMKSNFVLLEPVYKYEIIAEKNLVGKITSDILKMRGEVNVNFYGEKVSVKGYVPVDTSKEYAINLASFSKNSANFYTEFFGYVETGENVGLEITYKEYVTKNSM